jgi:transcriptional regulator with XRE-family HTH domain
MAHESGRRLRRLRENVIGRGNNHLSRQDFATHVEMSMTAASDWEKNGVPGAEQLERIARSLGCSLDWLILGEGEPYRSTGAGGIEGGGQAFGQRLKPSPEPAPQTQGQPQSSKEDAPPKPSSGG